MELKSDNSAGSLDHQEEGEMFLCNFRMDFNGVFYDEDNGDPWKIKVVSQQCPGQLTLVCPYDSESKEQNCSALAKLNFPEINTGGIIKLHAC